VTDAEVVAASMCVQEMLCVKVFGIDEFKGNYADVIQRGQ
jgi:hypothetical protein